MGTVAQFGDSRVVDGHGQLKDLMDCILVCSETYLAQFQAHDVAMLTLCWF